MPKPNVNFSLTEIKEYIKMKGLDKPEIKLSMSRAQLVEGLKKHGHWDDSVEKVKKTRVSKKPKAPPKEKKPRGRPKGSKNKKPTKPKKLSKGQEDFLGGIDDSPKKAAPKKTDEELTDEAKEKKEDFLKYGQGVGKRVSFRGKVNTSNPEKTMITVGVIEGFTNKGIVMRADKGKVSKEGADKKIGSVNYNRTQIVWKPTSGTTKKVVSWSTAKGGPEPGGKGGAIVLKTIGG